jgi:CRISPR/Cas system-associated protein Cas10 (large subunit of type III CRISPR-Cas system)
MKVNCKNCQKEFEKLNNQVIKHPNHFCSRSCSAIYNNKGRQRNPPIERKCSKCEITFFSTKENRRSRLLCSNCRKKYDQHTDFIKSNV